MPPPRAGVAGEVPVGSGPRRSFLPFRAPARGFAPSLSPAVPLGDAPRVPRCGGLRPHGPLRGVSGDILVSSWAGITHFDVQAAVPVWRRSSPLPVERFLGILGLGGGVV